MKRDTLKACLFGYTFWDLTLGVVVSALLSLVRRGVGLALAAVTEHAGLVGGMAPVATPARGLAVHGATPRATV